MKKKMKMKMKMIQAKAWNRNETKEHGNHRYTMEMADRNEEKNGACCGSTAGTSTNERLGRGLSPIANPPLLALS